MIPKKEISEVSDFHPTVNEFGAFWIPKAVPTVGKLIIITNKIPASLNLNS